MPTSSPPSFLLLKDAAKTVPPQGGTIWFGIAVGREGVHIVPLEETIMRTTALPKLIVPPSERGTVFYRMGFAVKNEGGIRWA